MLNFGDWKRLLPLASAGLLLLSLAGAYADSGEVGPAFHIGANPVYGPAPEYQINAAVAFGGAGYFAVWSDPRSGGAYDIYGARVSAGGATLDYAGVPISTLTSSQEDPAIAFDGSNYLVVWKDGRNGIASDIYGSRVSTAGEVLDPAGLAISITPEAQADAAVAFGDTAYLVVWVDARNGVANIYGARVTTGGAVLDPAGIAICADPAGQTAPAVASDGSGWLVVWQDNRDGEPDIYGARVGADGAVLDSVGIAIASAAGTQAYPAIASCGAGYLVVWDDLRSGTSRDVYAARVAADGTVRDAAGIAISALATDEELAAATFDGTNYFLVWDDLRNGGTWDIYGSRVDTAGTVLDPGGLAVTTYASQEFAPTVASSGPTALVAWHDSRNGPKDIYGIRVGADGTILDSAQILISMAAANQACPRIASDGETYLAAWQEWRLGTTYDIFATRLGPDGTVLDTLAITLAEAARDQLYPTVAAGGSGWLTAWQDYRSGAYDIYGSRVSSAGAVLDPAGLVITSASGPQEYPAAASDGTGYLVVWQDKRSGGYDIYGSRVAGDGTVLDPAGIPISIASGDQTRPAVAFDGTGYLVVWQDLRGGVADIYGARVSAGGAVLDPSGIAFSTATGAQELPALAFDGTNFLAVWQDRRGGPYADIYGARVSRAGTLVDSAGIAISTAANEQLAPAIGFDGWKYVIAWQDKRSNATSPDIYGAKVDRAGVVLDPTGIQIAKVPYAQMMPAVAADPSGQVLVAYSSFNPAPPYASTRIWANFYDSRAGVPDGPGGADPPGRPRLFASRPNPSAGPTTVVCYLPQGGQLSVAVFDARGRLVKELAGGRKEAGTHEIRWDGSDLNGRPASPGVYFIKMTAPGGSSSAKAVLVR